MSELTYTTVDRILSKLHRELNDTELNEGSVIAWIGEALDFLKVHQILEESVSFFEVIDYEVQLPSNFHMILQIARDNDYTLTTDETTACTTENTDTKDPDKVYCPVPIDCQGRPTTDYEVAYYRPYSDLKWEYEGWTNSSSYRKKFTPVRLADSTFFNSFVCKEKNQDFYSTCVDEYTIVGTTSKSIRLSFREGGIAVSYLRSAVDEETGYPLIPDNISCITAITYYIRWKISEWWSWNGREGAAVLAANSERLWLKYARQTKGYMKMPKSIDDYQNLLEMTHHLIPKQNRAYEFFGNLGRFEDRTFNDPDSRTRHTRNNYGR